MANDRTFSMVAEYVEVCFPAWPTSRSVAVPLAARFWQGIDAGPLEAAAFVMALVAVPGAIAALSVVMLTLILAFVLLAPGALALLAWASWRHDRPLRHARPLRLAAATAAMPADHPTPTPAAHGMACQPTRPDGALRLLR